MFDAFNQWVEEIITKYPVKTLAVFLASCLIIFLISYLVGYEQGFDESTKVQKETLDKFTKWVNTEGSDESKG